VEVAASWRRQQFRRWEHFVPYWIGPIGSGFSIQTMKATTSSGKRTAEFLCSHLLVLFGDGNPNGRRTPLATNCYRDSE